MLIKIVLGLWHRHKYNCWLIIKKRLSFGILLKLLAKGTGQSFGRKNWNKQSQWSAYYLVQCLCDWFHWYFYPLLLIFTCFYFIFIVSKILKMKNKRYRYHNQVLRFITVHLAHNHFHSDKIAQYIERWLQSCENINITVGFLSLIFYVTCYFVFML